MKAYKLIKRDENFTRGWTEGNIYKTDKQGCLVDDKGRERLRAIDYVGHHVFKEIHRTLENK